MGADRQIAINEGDLVLIRAKARQLVGRNGFTRSDRSDIEQNLVVHVIENLPRFDATRGRRTTFVDRIVNHRVASILRHRCAQRRDYRRSLAFEQAPVNDDGEQFEPADRRQAHADPPPDLKFDLANAVETLNDELRQMCGLLMHESIADTARRLGLTRAEARTRIARIRRLFADAGLATYLHAESAKPDDDGVCNE